MGRLPFSTKIIIALRNSRLQLLRREFKRKVAKMCFFLAGGGGGRGVGECFATFLGQCIV